MLTTKSLLICIACLRVVVRFVSLFVLLGHLPRSLCCPRCLAGLLLVGWLAGWLLVCWLCPWTPLRLVSGLVFCLALCFLMVGHSTWSQGAICYWFDCVPCTDLMFYCTDCTVFVWIICTLFSLREMDKTL